MKRVLVTGMGVISALGKNAAENLAQLQKSESGIGVPIYLDSSFANDFVFGEVKMSTASLKAELGLQDANHLTRTDLFAICAVSEALADAKLSPEEISSFDTAIISSSTVGGMSETDRLYEDANLQTSGSAFLQSYGSGAHLLNLVKHFHLRGTTDTINTACSSSANAIMLGAKLIKAGRANRVIVGGTDSLCKFTINGFNALQILSKIHCRPFDETRNGLNLGEAAAYLVLESADVVGSKKVYAEIRGYGNANDAHHASALSEEATGVIAAMSKALESAQIVASDVDYVNAHGTATENNDITEITGLQRIFEKTPPYNSTKSYTGHTLAAAGAIEAIYSIFSIVNGELYASLHCETPITVATSTPIRTYTKSRIYTVLSNSFGFGGNCTSLIIAKA